MEQFTFEAKQKSFLFGAMALGLLCLLLSYFMEPEQIAAGGFHSRFWSNFLLNSVFYAGMAFMATFTLAAFITAYSGWHVSFKRLWEGFSLFLLPGLILMVIIGIANYLHANHLYHWADSGAVAEDVVLQGKSGFLNNGWYLFGTIIIVGAWYFFATRLRAASVHEDAENTESSNFKFHRNARFYAAVFLPIAAFSGPAMVWQWVMSVDAHWYSTLFAWYTMSSWFVAVCALSILLLIYLKSKGYFTRVSVEHLHDLGKYMFAFSIFWAYCWFSQYMLIWYGNIGEETIHFKERLVSYPTLFYGNLLINFAIPFLVLMRNTTKRRYGTLIFTSILVFFGHWVDFFFMVKPGVLITAQEALAKGGEVERFTSFVSGFTLPGLVDIGVFIGFTAFFVYFVFRKMEKASLFPSHDPYIEESLHHEVQPYE